MLLKIVIRRILLSIFVVGFFSTHTMRNNIPVRGISPFVKKVIHTIYNDHNLGHQILGLNFLVAYHEEMLPENAFESNILKISGTIISHGISDEEDKKCILLSPALNKIIETQSIFYKTYKSSSLTTTHTVVFHLLRTLGEINFKKSFQSNEDSEQAIRHAIQFAIKNMHINELEALRESFEHPLYSTPEDTTILELTREKLKEEAAN